MKKVLIISDNLFIVDELLKIAESKDIQQLATFTVRCSKNNAVMLSAGFEGIHVKSGTAEIINSYDLVLSAHCKQLFPPELVRGVRCINVHPGLNPHNRGWFPQVFSILNKLPLGATIHEIDEELDHGPIIVQEPVPIFAEDTSLSAYNRVVQAELSLLKEHLSALITGSYQTFLPEAAGNLNFKKDFNALLELKLDEVNTFKYFLDKLRALTHGEYQNAYFVNETGEHIYVNISLVKRDK